MWLPKFHPLKANALPVSGQSKARNTSKQLLISPVPVSEKKLKQNFQNRHFSPAPLQILAAVQHHLLMIISLALT